MDILAQTLEGLNFTFETYIRNVGIIRLDRGHKKARIQQRTGLF
jgi:hypothetical protein